MTEGEAKEKWCPHVRYTALPMSNGDAAVYDNRSSEVAFHAPPLCIGSRCMAWRWTKEPNEGQPLGKPRTAGEGFCGLAGKP